MELHPPAEVRISQSQGNVSRSKRVFAIAALIASSVLGGCSKNDHHQELEEARQDLEEARHARDKAWRRAEKTQQWYDEKFLKKADPKDAQEKIAKARVAISEAKDALDREIAEDDLNEAIRACKLSLQGFKERNGYDSDVSCR